MTEPGFLYDKSKAGGEPTLTGNIFDGRLSSLQSLACAPAPDRLFGATRAYTNSFNNREHVPELEHPGKFCQMSGGDLGRRDMSSFAPLPRAALANIQVQDLPIPSYYLIFHSAKKQVYLLRQFFQNFYSSSGMSNFLGKQYNAWLHIHQKSKYNMSVAISKTAFASSVHLGLFFFELIENKESYHSMRRPNQGIKKLCDFSAT